MDAKHMWLQKLVKRKEIVVTRIDGRQNAADVVTKDLERPMLQYPLGKLP